MQGSSNAVSLGAFCNTHFGDKRTSRKRHKIDARPDLIDGMGALSKSCVKYALRKTGEALSGYRSIRGEEEPVRRKAWVDITFTRNLEECVAAAARELSETAGFDRDIGKANLLVLSPLYKTGGAPASIDATATLISATMIDYERTSMSLRDFLDIIWRQQWKDVVVDNPKDSAAGIFCLLHLGYVSGARIHIRNSDGSWLKGVFNAMSGEKRTALTINQCLSGDGVEDSKMP